MLLKKIKLENFRQYYGTQELEFSIDHEKNITLIYGKNGAGKTSLFTAINWALYGSTDIKIDGKIVNKKAISEAILKKESYVKAEVTLNFSHNGVDYQIKRSITYDIQNQKEINQEVEMSQIYPSFKKITEPLTALNPMLPPNVRTYFFFDGEKIDEFSKPEHDREVKDAVYQVLGFNTIDRAITHLRDILKEYNKEIGQKSSGRLRDLYERYNELLKQEEELEKKLQELKDERKNLEINIEEIKGRLREIEEIQEYMKKKDNIEYMIKDTEDQLEIVYDELLKIVNESFIFIGAKALDLTEELIKNELQNSNDIPSKYLIKFIEKLLEEKTCICGETLDPSKRNTLLRKKAEISIEIKENPTDEIFSTIRESLTKFKYLGSEKLEDLKSKFIKKEELKEKLEELKKQLDEIDQMIGSYPTEDVRKLINELETASENYGSMETKIEKLENDLKDKKKDIENIQREIASEERKEKIIEEIRKKKYLSEEILRQLENTYEKLSKSLRIEVEKETTSIFSDLIRKKDFFKKVELSEDYILKLVDMFGDKEAKTEISAGERQVLSLSFILALAKVSNKEAPLVMDTPFGRLDPEHRMNILNSLPNLTKQLVLFVTPSEMTQDLRNLIDSKVGKEYELEFDKTDSYTKIIPLDQKV